MIAGLKRLSELRRVVPLLELSKLAVLSGSGIAVRSAFLGGRLFADSAIAEASTDRAACSAVKLGECRSSTSGSTARLCRLDGRLSIVPGITTSSILPRGLTGASEAYRSGALINWEHPPVSRRTEQRATIGFRAMRVTTQPREGINLCH
jgi:hypothetical protein